MASGIQPCYATDLCQEASRRGGASDEEESKSQDSLRCTLAVVERFPWALEHSLLFMNSHHLLLQHSDETSGLIGFSKGFKAILLLLHVLFLLVGATVSHFVVCKLTALILPFAKIIIMSPSPPAYHLAQVNVARIKGDSMEDPVMKEFKDNLDFINRLAESSPGFVWRLQDDDDDETTTNNGATSIRPYPDDARILINLSLWKNLDSLKEFAYKSPHRDFVKRRGEWFEPFGKRYLALWWVPRDVRPTPADAVAKLEYLEQHGPTAEAFTFQKHFPTPDGA